MGEEDADVKSPVVFVAPVEVGKEKGKDKSKEEGHVQTVKLVLERDEDVKAHAGGRATVVVDVDAAEGGEKTEPPLAQQGDE